MILYRVDWHVGVIPHICSSLGIILLKFISKDGHIDEVMIEFTLIVGEELSKLWVLE